MIFSATRFSVLIAALLPLSALACGGTDSTVSTGPVSDAPLAGMIDGKAFAAKSAIGVVFDPASGKRTITISGGTVTCAMNNIDGPAVLTSVDWKEGTAIPFDLSHNATLTYPSGDTFKNDVSTNGRIEVIKAPTTVGAKGTIRIRAVVDDNNTVEGQVDVEICPDF
jgi:hypothetical protein